MSKYGVYSGPYFAAIGLNTERSPYLSVFSLNVSPYSVRYWASLDYFQWCNQAIICQKLIRFSAIFYSVSIAEKIWENTGQRKPVFWHILQNVVKTEQIQRFMGDCHKTWLFFATAIRKFFQRKASEIRKSKHFLFSLCCKDQKSLAFKITTVRYTYPCFILFFVLSERKAVFFWKKTYCSGTSTTRNKLLFKYLKLNSKVNSIWLYSHLLQCYPVF